MMRGRTNMLWYFQIIFCPKNKQNAPLIFVNKCECAFGPQVSCGTQDTWNFFYHEIKNAHMHVE